MGSLQGTLARLPGSGVSTLQGLLPKKPSGTMEDIFCGDGGLSLLDLRSSKPVTPLKSAFPALINDAVFDGLRDDSIAR